MKSGCGLIAAKRLRKDLERNNFVAVEREHKLELDWTSRKISGKAIGDDCFTILLGERKRLDRVLIFFFCFCFPLLDLSQTSMRFILIAHHGTFGEAFVEQIRVAGILPRDVKPDRLWKIVDHPCGFLLGGSSCFS